MGYDLFLYEYRDQQWYEEDSCNGQAVWNVHRLPPIVEIGSNVKFENSLTPIFRLASGSVSSNQLKTKLLMGLPQLVA